MFMTRTILMVGILFGALCAAVVYSGLKRGETTPARALAYTIASSAPGDETSIYIQELDRHFDRSVPNQTGNEYTPAWSPNGFDFAFASNREGQFKIFITSLNGTVRRLTDFPANNPAWSPDGKWIAFEAPNFDDDDNMEIYMMRADGSDVRNVTQHGSLDYNPTWSPDGMQMAFLSRRDGNQSIYIQDLNTGNVRRLTTFDSDQPAWSPDGTRIAFVSSVDAFDGQPDIFTIDIDGSNLQNLSRHSAPDYNPSWSPDSREIAWESNRDGNLNIYIMRDDGSNVRQITDTETNDTGPTWMPPVTPRQG